MVMPPIIRSGILIEGIGRRTADVSFDWSPAQAPELCGRIQSVPIFDCPLNANIGDACNDGDNTTLNDAIDNNCNCAGTPTACTGIGDNDGDGICADVDCDDNDPNSTSQPGDPCDDGDNTTLNDAIDNNCNCAGIPTACTGIGDNDGDGVCADVDCDDNDPNSTSQPGDFAMTATTPPSTTPSTTTATAPEHPPPAPVSATTTATASAPM